MPNVFIDFEQHLNSKLGNYAAYVAVDGSVGWSVAAHAADLQTAVRDGSEVFDSISFTE